MRSQSLSPLGQERDTSGHEPQRILPILLIFSRSNLEMKYAMKQQSEVQCKIPPRKAKHDTEKILKSSGGSSSNDENETFENKRLQLDDLNDKTVGACAYSIRWKIEV